MLNYFRKGFEYLRNFGDRYAGWPAGILYVWLSLRVYIDTFSSCNLSAALLLELEKRINEVPIDSGEMGFTRHGSYIYEFLAAMKITYETATILIDTIEQATTLLEDGK